MRFTGENYTAEDAEYAEKDLLGDPCDLRGKTFG